MSTETDKQGRLYLPEKVREEYGEKYHIVTYEDKIELIPVADDPLEAARAAAGELRDASIPEIRENIEEGYRQYATASEAPGEETTGVSRESNR